MLAARANDGRYEPFSFTPRRRARRVASVESTLPAPSTTRSHGWPTSSRSSSRARRSSGRRARTRSRAAPTRGNTTRSRSSGRSGSPRTPEQEAVAQFYSVNPVELFNRTFRTIAGDRGLTLAERSPAVRDAEHGQGGRSDQLLERQGVLEQLAADHRDPARATTTATRAPSGIQSGRRSSPLPRIRTMRPGTTA